MAGVIIPNRGSGRWLDPINSVSLPELEAMTDPKYLKHDTRTANLASPQLRSVLGSTVILATPSSEFHKNGKYWHQYILFTDFVTYRNKYHLSMADAVDKAIRESDVHIYCSCYAFLYWGNKYFATRDGYGYGSYKERRAPKRNNVNGKNRLCKHMSKALIWLEANRNRLVAAFTDYYESLKARKDGTLVARDGEGREEIMAVDVGGEPIRTTYVPDVDEDTDEDDVYASMDPEEDALPEDRDEDEGIGSSLLYGGRGYAGRLSSTVDWGDFGLYGFW